MAKKKHFKKVKETMYHVNGIIAELSHNENSTWGKYVARCAMNDEPETIDVRHIGFDKVTGNYKVGKGVALNPTEADILTDTLLELGYGHIEVLDKELKRRKKLYGFSINDEEIESESKEELVLEV